MTALNNLAAFVIKLPKELQPEFMKLVDAVTDERDRLQNERIGQSMARLGNYEVVAIEGTSETLLSDVADTNVGEIKEGDKVMLSVTNNTNQRDLSFMNLDFISETEIYSVNNVEILSDTACIGFKDKSYMHPAKYFRKVSPQSLTL